MRYKHTLLPSLLLLAAACMHVTAQIGGLSDSGFGGGFGDIAGGSFFGPSIGSGADPGLVGIAGLGLAGSSPAAFAISGSALGSGTTYGRFASNPRWRRRYGYGYGLGSAPGMGYGDPRFDRWPGGMPRRLGSSRGRRPIAGVRSRNGWYDRDDWRRARRLRRRVSRPDWD